jgi:oligopeptidase A
MTDTARTAANPLLDFSGLPRFASFEPGLVTPALDVALADARAAVERAESPATAATWTEFVQPLEDATERLGRVWGVVGHLNSVADTPELRAVYNENLPRATEFWTALGQNTALFAKYKALQASPEFATLSAAQKRIVEHAIRGFRLGGAELVSPARERYAEIQERGAALAQKFGENVLDATKAFALDVTDEAFWAASLSVIGERIAQYESLATDLGLLQVPLKSPPATTSFARSWPSSSPASPATGSTRCGRACTPSSPPPRS